MRRKAALTSESPRSFCQDYERIKTETETWDHATKERRQGREHSENIKDKFIEDGKGLKMMKKEENAENNSIIIWRP